jgi:Spy/CpxP family protein refolding chaperone
MRRLLLAPLALGLLGLAAGVDAQTAGKKTAPGGDTKAVDRAFSFPKEIELTDEQKAKIDELKKEFAPRFDKIRAEMRAVMTDERRKVVEEVRKEAKAEGKKGKEVDEMVAAKLKLSPAEQAKLQEARAAREELMKEVNERKMAVLTAKQREHLQAIAAAKKKESSKKE